MGIQIKNQRIYIWLCVFYFVNFAVQVTYSVNHVLTVRSDVVILNRSRTWQLALRPLFMCVADAGMILPFLSSWLFRRVPMWVVQFVFKDPVNRNVVMRFLADFELDFPVLFMSPSLVRAAPGLTPYVLIPVMIRIA